MINYGDGPSTGLDQTAAGKVTTGFTPNDLSMTPGDRALLRRLAERVAAIAASGRMREVRQLWTNLNGLRPVRPLVFCDPENGWNEIITEAQMECQGKLARRWEMDLRKEIFWGEELLDDKPVEPYFDVPFTVSPDDWGIEATYHKTETSGSYVWKGEIKDYQTDLRKLHAPRFEIDWETTDGCRQIAQAVLGDLLTVRRRGVWWWSLGVTWRAATYRGLQNMLCDFIENPDGLKELLALDLARAARQARLSGIAGSAEPEQRRHVRGLGRIRLQRRAAGARFHRPGPRGTSGASPKARKRCTSRRRCTRSSSSLTRSRSWSGSG